MSKVKSIDKKNHNSDRNNKKSKNEENKKKQAQSKMRSSLPQIVTTSQKLQNKISTFKNQHAAITKTLQQAITNNNLYRSISASQLQSLQHQQFLDKKHARKQKSLLNLQKSLQKRVQLNEQAQNRLNKMQQDVINKKQQLSKKLAQIQSRNIQKIMQIEEFERNFLQKVKLQLNKNIQKQKKLKKQYEKISQQNVKLVKTKQFQNKLDGDAWKQIMNEKINLQVLMQNQKNKQNKLIQQKNPQIAKKKQIQAAKIQQKKVVRQKVKLDIKQAGRQYLDFAKKKATNPKQNKKLKKDYMNINLKVINYDNQTLQRLGNNNGALSLIDKQEINEQQNTIEEKTTQKTQNTTLKNKHNQSDIIPILQQNEQQSDESDYSDIGKAVSMVNKIKKNIQQIQQRYNNKQIF